MRPLEKITPGPGVYVSMDREQEAEKRRFERVSNQFFVRACRADQAEDPVNKAAGIVHDISEGGLSFITDQEFVPAEILELEIEMTGIRPPEDGGRGLLNSAVIVTHATVVRKGLYEFGPNIVAARFDSLDPADRKLLLEAIKMLNAEQNNKRV